MSLSPLSVSKNAFLANHDRIGATATSICATANIDVEPASGGTAVVYCEANFAVIDGKTANGLVRHSEMYEILGVIDSEKSGLDAGEVLDEKPNGIRICRDLADSIRHAGCVPDYFIFGMAPASGMLSADERGIVLEAIGLGMNIVNGLHEFLNDDPKFAAASEAGNVTILDIRKPRDSKDLRMWGDLAQSAFGTNTPIADRGLVSQTILAVGHQDTDPDGLDPPPGIEILGASSDHLVVESKSDRLSIGTEVAFQVNYSAMLRSMTSPFVAKVLTQQGRRTSRDFPPRRALLDSAAPWSWRNGRGI